MKKIATIIILASSIAPCLAQNLDMNLYKDAEIELAVKGHYTEVGEWETEMMNEGEEERKTEFEKLKAENKSIRGLYGKSGELTLVAIPEAEDGSGVHWFSIAEMMEEVGMTTEESGVVTPNANGAYLRETTAVGKDMFNWIIPEGLGAGDIFSDEDGQWAYILAKGTLDRFKEKVRLVKAHGFTEDSHENEVPGQMNIYQAESKDGYEVSVMLYQKKLSIIFDKRP